MKKKSITAVLTAAILSVSLCACGGNTPADSSTDTDANNITNEASGTESTPEPTAEPTAEPTPEPTAEPTTEPTDTPTPEVTKAAEKEDESMNEFVDTIVVADTLPMYTNCGTLEEITYTTKDYFGDGAAIEKKAFVYLPADYSADRKYNVLYLMHGIGGSEREWGMVDRNSKVKCIMDNLISKGEIEPFIIVTPNGRSGKDFADPNSDYNSFYLFGQELRNDLIPYIDSHYSTYGEYSEDGYDLTAARDHRAMAGLSMGGMQTTNIGMCECLDILSYFGAFSAAPTTYNASRIAQELKKFEEYPIHYYYAICGKQDGVAYSPARAAVNGLPDLTDKLTDGVNFKWQEVTGQHDFNVWYLGFYNFANIVFK